MQVSKCMSTEAYVCSPEDTIQQAAQTMRSIDAGFLPVGQDDRLIGMITDRDIAVRCVADGRGPDTPVREAMTQEVHYCFDSDELEDAAAQMASLQVRRLPVLNSEKRLVGVISLGDISIADQGQGRSGPALSAVSQPSELHSQH